MPEKQFTPVQRKRIAAQAKVPNQMKQDTEHREDYKAPAGGKHGSRISAHLPEPIDVNWKKIFLQATRGGKNFNTPAQDPKPQSRKPKSGKGRKPESAKPKSGKGKKPEKDTPKKDTPTPYTRSELDRVRRAVLGSKRTTRARGSTGAQSGKGADPYGTLARAVAPKKQPKSAKGFSGITPKTASLDELQSSIQMALQIAKKLDRDITFDQNAAHGFANIPTREELYGQNNRKLRNWKNPNQNIKEQDDKNTQEAVTAGINYLNNIKQSLNVAFNSLLDAYQNKWVNKSFN